MILMTSDLHGQEGLPAGVEIDECEGSLGVAFDDHVDQRRPRRRVLWTNLGRFDVADRSQRLRSPYEAEHVRASRRERSKKLRTGCEWCQTPNVDMCGTRAGRLSKASHVAAPCGLRSLTTAPRRRARSERMPWVGRPVDQCVRQVHQGKHLHPECCWRTLGL